MGSFPFPWEIVDRVEVRLAQGFRRRCEIAWNRRSRRAHRCLKHRRRIRTAQAYPAIHPSFLFPFVVDSARFPRSQHSRSLGDSGAHRRRADHRVDGAIRVRENPRSRHSRGDRSDPVRQEQDVAEGRAPQASVLGHRDWQRWPFRRRRTEHHDRRGHRLAVGAISPHHRE
jgi:hypothetical protein